MVPSRLPDNRADLAGICGPIFQAGVPQPNASKGRCATASVAPSQSFVERLIWG